MLRDHRAFGLVYSVGVRTFPHDKTNDRFRNDLAAVDAQVTVRINARVDLAAEVLSLRNEEGGGPSAFARILIQTRAADCRHGTTQSVRFFLQGDVHTAEATLYEG